MIDLALGAGMAVSEWWAAPVGSVSLAWRPMAAVELQVAGSAVWMEAGRFTAAGKETSRCFCDGMVDRVAAAGALTVGVFPVREQVGLWEVEAGLRVGAALVQDRPAEYLSWRDEVQINEEPPILLPGWTVEAVAGAGFGRFGVRVRLERLAWVSLEWDGASAPVLLPRVEGYVRW